MSNGKLQVIVDQLREMPEYQDVARWIERPDVVRALLSYVPATGGLEDGESDHCAGCDATIDGSGQLIEPHDRRCRVLVMWQVLGHPLGDPAIEYERAWNRAIRQEQNRERARRSREEYARRSAPLIRVHSSPFAKDGEAFLFEDRALRSAAAIEHLNAIDYALRPQSEVEKTRPTLTIPAWRKAGEPVDPGRSNKK